MSKPRVLVWFSCGAASAVAAKNALHHYHDYDVEICYCDTLAYEHADNMRFMTDCEKWLGQKINILKSKKYTDIYDVFDKTGWLVGAKGARCTTELKKVVREEYQRPDDIHIFGLTSDEFGRIERMKKQHFELNLDFILHRIGLDKNKCLEIISEAGIELPAMYKLGYNNNNCIGCVKGGIGYWNKIRKDFPDAFKKMAEQERKMGTSCLKEPDGFEIVNGKNKIKYKPLFLDSLEPNRGNHKTEHKFDCGVMCQIN